MRRARGAPDSLAHIFVVVATTVTIDVIAKTLSDGMNSKDDAAALMIHHMKRGVLGKLKPV